MCLPSSASSPIIRHLRALSDEDGCLRFDEFMRVALYHPEFGYYRRNQQRVGTERGTDFFTASSVGTLFGELVIAATHSLLAGKKLNPADFHFIEIGAEPDRGILHGLAHPFAAERCIRVGEGIHLEGPCIVFSNELFDAQPVRRFIRREDTWWEQGVRITEDGSLSWKDYASAGHLPFLPSEAPIGYVFDAPCAAASLAEQIAGKAWHGLFIAFDYGKTRRALAEEAPSGTLRAYYRHTQEKDLLARPGEQDLTCHICWDWLEDALKSSGAHGCLLESQESFFIHHAGSFLSKEMAGHATTLSKRKLALMQLLHPGNMGQKFQVLSAWKWAR